MDTLTYKGTVYPWHCDHVGHMNVMWYTGKFDEATWNLFAELGITPSYLREQQRGMVGVQQNTSYKQELLAGDVIEIRSQVLEVRDKVIRFKHEMRNIETNTVAATTELTAVHLDRQVRKSCAFPPAILAAAEARLS
ncbi:MAG TPA: thioesterase family protein [Candidatus Angelobacter sp.]|nr:thioesterase family protein [Candidatus Angelobacter sp.]